MLINFIGISFLCGIGIGCIIVLVLVLSRRATEQRIKWAVLGSALVTTVMAIAATVYVLWLPAPEKQIRSQLDMIPIPSHSSQLFEHDYIISSAAGNCSTTMLDRWFGLDVGNNEQMLIEWYSNQLMAQGWQQRENAAWQKNDSDSLFQVRIEVFAAPTRIDSQQWFYSISNDELKEASAYRAIYVLKSSVELEEARAKCLGE